MMHCQEIAIEKNHSVDGNSDACVLIQPIPDIKIDCIPKHNRKIVLQPNLGRIHLNNLLPLLAHQQVKRVLLTIVGQARLVDWEGQTLMTS